MNYKLLTLLFFIFPGLVEAESEIFELNGKPVPAVVAKVNGVSLNSYQLQTEYDFCLLYKTLKDFLWINKLTIC